MKKTMVWLFGSLALLFILLILALLGIPSVSRMLLQAGSERYLGHTLTIRAYHFNPFHLYLDGSFDDNSTIFIDASNLIFANRYADVRLNASTSFFDNLLETTLPNVGFDLNATLQGDRLIAAASLLDGRLETEANLSNLKYHYIISNLSIERFLHEQKLPIYAVGRLSAAGSGEGTGNLLQKVQLISNNLKLESPLLSLAGLASLPKKLDAKVKSTLTFDMQNGIDGTIRLESSLFTLVGDGVNYNLQSGTFTLPLSLHGLAVDEIPFKEVSLLAIGQQQSGRVRADIIAEADTYLLVLRDLVYDGNVSSAFRLTSFDTKTFNIGGTNALHGNFSSIGNEANITLSTANLGVPIVLHYAQNKLDIDAKSLPVAPIFSMLNRKAELSGTLDIDGRIGFGAKYPDISMHIASHDLMPERSLAKPLGIEHPSSLRLDISNHENSYLATMSIRSDLFNTDKVIAKYDVKTGRGHLKALLKKIHVGQYGIEHLNMEASVDAKRSMLYNMRLYTPFSSIGMPKLHYAEPISGKLFYRFNHLDRLIPDLNTSVVFKGDMEISQQGKHKRLVLHTEKLGDFRIGIAPKAYTLSADGLDVKNFFTALGKPAPLYGTIDIEGRLDDRFGTLTLHSSKLRPGEDLRPLLRPFPLDVTLDLSRCDSRYFGKVNVHTAHDSLSLSGIDVDIFQKIFHANYRLDIPDARRSALVFPPKTLVRTSLKGTFTLQPQQQTLKIISNDLVLHRKLHRMLDENASMPMEVRTHLDITHTSNILALSGALGIEELSLRPVELVYDLNRSYLDAKAHLRTKRWIGDTDVSFKGFVERNATVHDASLHVAARNLRLDAGRLYADAAKNDFRADANLTLRSLVDSDHKAVVFVNARTLPALDVRMHTEAFHGNLKALMNDRNIIVHAQALDIPQTVNFFKPVTMLKSGTLDGDIYLNTPAVLESNLSRLNGGIDLKVHHMLLEGIEIDGYLETLRNSQDFSLFQGSVSDLPIIRSVKNIPSDLVNKKKVQTDIEEARIAVAIHDGIATCGDCAAATDKHRFAFAGDVNLSSQRFGYFYFALLNPEGCPYFTQRIKGPLAKPEINLAESGIKVVGGAVVSVASNVTDAANWLTKWFAKLTSSAGDVVSYIPIAGDTADRSFKKVGNSVHGLTETVSGCTPFYLGTVKHPGKK